MAEKYEPNKKDKKLIEKWGKRFKRAKQFHQLYLKRRLEFYKLYRAYREKTNYAYETNLMPPIAFEIVETVKPRLASAKVNVRILPRFKKDLKSKSLESWDDKIKYDLDVIKFQDKKISWIDSMLQFGDGIGMLTWKPGKEKNGNPFFSIQDLWLFYPDPEATDLQEDSGFEIQLLYKTKDKLKKKEEVRDEKTDKLKSGIYKNLEYVEEKEITDDPRKDRYEINTKKMGQIAKGKAGEGEKSEDKQKGEKKVELWQIWDHEENKLIVIANKEILIRDEENPYINVNDGKLFIKLSDHKVLWNLWSIGHIEPIETTINEIADSRNQAMDDIVFNLDPIRKVREGAHLTADDLINEPGAIWQLKRADDVVIERPPPVDRQWLAKDELLRKEIQTSLAISEYAMGLPKSPQEPKGKVELLLMQTNIRFSLLLRQFEIALTQVVNNLIGLNDEFLTEEESYRLIGKKEVNFKEFKMDDKKVKVDSIVELEPKVEKTAQQRKAEIIELYKIFVSEDKPDPENEEEVKKWKIKKRTLQKIILEEYGKEQYEDLILGEEEKEKEKPKELPQPPAKPPAEIPPMPGVGPGASPGIMQRLIAKIPLINKI